MGLRQGEHTMADYCIDFNTRASFSNWNYAALVDALFHGLAGYIKDELGFYDVTSTLDAIIELATRIDL